MHAEIEKGTVLEINDTLTIDRHYTVFYYGIPVGTAKDNLTWFPSNPRKSENSQIKQIVYLGDYKWGVKQLTLPIEEFESFGQTLKEQILCDFLEMQGKYADFIEERGY
jgi:hypothetical protein